MVGEDRIELGLVELSFLVEFFGQGSNPIGCRALGRQLRHDSDEGAGNDNRLARTMFARDYREHYWIVGGMLGFRSSHAFSIDESSIERDKVYMGHSRIGSLTARGTINS